MKVAIGLGIAIFPYMKTAGGTIFGLIILGIGVFSLGIGSIYYNKTQLKLPRIVVNTWQNILGSLIALPLTFLLEPNFYIKSDFSFWFGLIWSVFFSSIIVMLLWFYLLKEDTVSANNFLFLTPIFGYALAAIFLQESLTLFHYIGGLFVIFGMAYSQTNKKRIKEKGLKERETEVKICT